MIQPENAAQPAVDQGLLRDFVDESRELLETVSQGLLQMEDDADDRDVVDSVFRALHTIKGCSSFLGLHGINKLSHAGENVLDGIRQGGIAPARDIIDSLLMTCDLLSALLDDALAPAEDAERDQRYGEAMSQLADILAAREKEPAEEAEPAESTEPAAHVWPPAGANLSSELIRQFVTENGDNLLEVEAGLLRLEEHPGDLSTLNAVFRPIHTIKGTADYVGLAQIKTLSHYLESVLDLARSGRLCWSSQVTSSVLEGVDALKSMIQSLQPDGEDDRDLTQLVAGLLRIIDGAAAEAQRPASAGPAPARGASQLGVFAFSASQHLESIHVEGGKLTGGDLSEVTIDTLRRSVHTLLNAADYMERHEFVSPCEQFLDLIDRLPETADAVVEKVREEIQTLTTMLQKLLDEVHSESQRGLFLEPLLAIPGVAGAAGDATAATQAAGGKAPAAKSMRVEQEKLDEYINLAGELVIARNTLTHAFHEIEGMPASHLRRLKAAIECVDRIAATIQDNAMSMRMVPVKSLFQRFPRVVRDIAKAQGKQIELQIFGEDTEIDKQVAEALGDPLVHLVRNSADHGIEMPETRRAAGKDETGVVMLRASREGNLVVIEIIDDGAGINLARLKAKAVENGVITQQQADAMQPEEAFELIFAAGLSTAAQVTDISGRGVGMDVVRTNIRSCGGNVFVTSQPGSGTQLRIELPLTLAVTTALVVVSEGQSYALPIETVKETIKVAPEQVKSLKGSQAVALRGRLVTLRNLASLLAPARQTGGKRYRFEGREGLVVDDTGNVPIVVVEVGGERFGLVVDAVEGRQDIVLKPLPEYLARLPGLSSATVMGDGAIVLILDPADMLAAALSQVSHEAADAH